MRKLGDRNYTLLSMGVNMTGTFEPDEALSYPMEQLYTDEYQELHDFMSFVHENDLAFGSGNYEEVFSMYKKSLSKVPDVENLAAIKAMQEMLEEIRI